MLSAVTDTIESYPKTIAEQPCNFFRIPRELRDEIYRLTFGVFEAESSASDVLSPLLTCRRFYVEARGIAFSVFHFRFDWAKIAEKYFGGPRQAHSVPDDSSTDITEIDSTCRHPNDFKIQRMAARAGLHHEHLRHLRTITVVTIDESTEIQHSWLLFSFLETLDQLLGSEFQLDLITLEVSLGVAQEDILQRLLPVMKTLWLQRVTKKITILNRNCVVDTAYYTLARPDWYHVSGKERLMNAGKAAEMRYNNEAIVSGNVYDRVACEHEIEDRDNALGWEWKVYRLGSWNAGQVIRCIDIMRK